MTPPGHSASAPEHSTWSANDASAPSSKCLRHKPCAPACSYCNSITVDAASELPLGSAAVMPANRSFPTASARILATLALAALSLVAAAEAQTLVPVGSPQLVYPEGAEGVAEVFVQVVIEPDGTISGGRVVRRNPEDASAAFDEAAVAFCKELRFEPVMVNGEPGRVQTELRLEFVPPEPDATTSLPPSPNDGADGGPVAGVESPDSPSVDRDASDSSMADAPLGTPSGDSRELSPFVAHVRGSRAPMSASDYHIHVGQLADVPRRSAGELLTLAPGVMLTNHGGDGHASAIFLRGFDAREGQDLEIKLDGVPLNDISNAHGHGYADTHFIIPELVDEVRVMEGPFDPRQGDFAVAGSAEYHLGLHERGSRIQGSYGSFNTGRLLALWGPAGEESGTFAGVDLRQADGFGVNRASASAALMAQYEAVLGARTRLFVLGQSYAGRFDSAGLLRDDDFQAGRLPCASGSDSQFFCTNDPNQGGASSRHGLSVRLVRRQEDSALEQQAFFATRDLRLRENLTGWLLDMPSPGAPQRGDGIEQGYKAVTMGLRGSYQTRTEWLNRRQDLEVGYIARYDEGDVTAVRLRRPGGEPYSAVFDHHLRVANLGLYGATTLRLVRGVTLRGGLRADTFAFSVLDRNRPAVDRVGERLPHQNVDAYGIALQPRGSVQVRLLDDLDWVTSLGTGARSSDAAALSDGETAPFARVTAAETGLVFDRPAEPRGWSLHGRASAFATHVDRDLVFDEVTGRNMLAGASNRFGALLHARAGLGNWLDMQGSFTWTEAYLASPDAAFYELTAGERMPYIPRFVTRLDAALRRTLHVAGVELPSSVALGVGHVGARPLPLGKSSAPIVLVDLAVKTRWRALEFGLEARNLLDARWRQAEFNYASNFASPDLPPSMRAARHFIAGEPRALLATLAVHFGGPVEDPHDDVHSDEETR